MTLLWHGAEPIGISVFSSAPMSLAPRNRYFGLQGRWNRTSLKMMNGQMVILSRVVIHPTYRGAGIAADFVRRSCELCPFRWIETLTQMGHVNPFFEKAGFVRVGACAPPKDSSLQQHSALYGGRRRHAEQGLVSQETHQKSQYAQPIYYVFDNRERFDGGKIASTPQVGDPG